jgi:hypothetical protein
MAGAFQSDAFQASAFQTNAAAPPVIGSSISGGSFSRKRWHELSELLRAEAAAREIALARKPKAREAITAAAQAAREIADKAEPGEALNPSLVNTSLVNTSLVRLAHAVEAAAGATSLRQTLALSSAVIAQAREARAAIERERMRRAAEREEEEIALLLAA